jgi:hypothetical protein
MSTVLCQPVNKAVLAFCTHAVETGDIKASPETLIHEFEDCEYHLLRERSDADIVVLSFKHQYPLAEEAVQATEDAYSDFACVREQPEDGYQITVEVYAASQHFACIGQMGGRPNYPSFQVSLPKLRQMEADVRSKSLEQLASLRRVVTGAALRSSPFQAHTALENPTTAASHSLQPLHGALDSGSYYIFKSMQSCAGTCW